MNTNEYFSKNYTETLLRNFHIKQILSGSSSQVQSIFLHRYEFYTLPIEEKHLLPTPAQLQSFYKTSGSFLNPLFLSYPTHFHFQNLPPGAPRQPVSPGRQLQEAQGLHICSQHHPKNSWEGCSVVQGENCILPIPSKESEFVNTDDIYTIFFVAFISCTTPTLRCVCLE